MAEYRIDDLARAAGTTVRNARVYQDRGLLPPPRRDGRVGWYSDTHLVRLRLIGRLLDRGYTFSVIGELLEAWEQGRDLREVLGLEEELTRSWSDELPSRVTLNELRKMFGTTNPRMISRAESLGLFKRAGTSFVVPSPRMLQAGVELIGLGVPIDEVLDIAEALARDMDLVADRFVRIGLRTLLPPAENASYPDDAQAREIAESVRRLRPQAQAAVGASFATAMSRRVSEEIDEVTLRIRGPRAVESRRGDDASAAVAVAATSDHHSGSRAKRRSRSTTGAGALDPGLADPGLSDSLPGAGLTDATVAGSDDELQAEGGGSFARHAPAADVVERPARSRRTRRG